MRLSISNIAWDVEEDEAVAALLQKYAVNAIDIAPGKYFPEPALASVDEIAAVRTWWADRGIDIVGMQSLLFGTTGFNVFGTPDAQAKMLEHLEAVCRIGGELDAPRLVFGSPKNRDRGNLTDLDTIVTASSFFRKLGDIAARHDVTVCLEPNPSEYGSNFMMTSVETAHVVEQVNHPNIRMQFDTGAITMNKEDSLIVLQQHGALIGHYHLSEPNLLPLGDGGTDHETCAKALETICPDSLLTIEMVATQNESHLSSIERALSLAISRYAERAKGQTL